MIDKELIDPLRKEGIESEKGIESNRIE